MPAFIFVEYDGTELIGFCGSEKQTIEQQQAEAIRNKLPLLLDADGSKWRAVDEMVMEFTNSVSDAWFPFGDKALLDVRVHFDSRGEVERTLRIVDGIIYLSRLYAKGASLNLAVLPNFVSYLPRLESFHCASCNHNSQGLGAKQLATSLATQAPQSLLSLKLEGSGVTGTLPQEWGQWSSLVTLSLRDNSIVGTLPASWSGMTSLRFLDLRNNPGLTGTIPVEWSTLQAEIDVLGTAITGCIPDQLVTKVSINNSFATPCSQGSPDVRALLKIGRILDPAGQVLASWNTRNSGPAQQAGKLGQVVSVAEIFTSRCNNE